MQGARLALVGAGALGCAVLPRLLRMPLAAITIVDGDRVEEHNLQRQELYAPVDVGRPKAAVAASWARQVPVPVKVCAEDVFLSPANADALLGSQQVVVDLTDDLHARQLIARTCATHGVALISGAVHAGEGQVLLLHAPGTGSATGLDDLFQGRPGPGQDGCDMRRVPPATIEAVAARVARRLRELLSGASVANGRIDLYGPAGGGWTEFMPPEPGKG